MTQLQVLIVEDSEDDLLLLLRELRRGDYTLDYVRVETAVEMQAALDRQITHCLGSARRKHWHYFSISNRIYHLSLSLARSAKMQR
jgi:hypothetical protein